MTDKLRSPSPASERGRGEGTPMQDMARGRERAPSPRLRGEGWGEGAGEFAPPAPHPLGGACPWACRRQDPRASRPLPALRGEGFRAAPSSPAPPRSPRLALDAPPARGDGGRDRSARPLDLRRAEIPRRLQAFRLRQPERAEGRHARAPDQARRRQPELRHLQHAQHLRPQGRRRGRHGRDLRQPDGAAPATSRTRSTASSPSKVRWSADKLTYRFLLRPEARFHDGSRLTARDVAFSLNILKTKGHPSYRTVLSEVSAAEAEADDVAQGPAVAETQPRPAPHRRRHADLLGGLLAGTATSRPRRSSRRSAPAPTRSGASSRAASSSSSACPIIGAATCR